MSEPRPQRRLEQGIEQTLLLLSHCSVYIPDFFRGEDMIQLKKDNPGKEHGELLQYLLNTHKPRDWERLPPVVEAIRKAQPSAKKIGAMGFCWVRKLHGREAMARAGADTHITQGATSCLFLGSKKAGAAQVDAVAFAHPSLIESTDFEMLNRPGLFMCCEHDPMYPSDKQEASKRVAEKLAKDGVFSRFSYYPFVSHGWSIKGDETNPYAAKAMRHAAAEAITFFSLELAP